MPCIFLQAELFYCRSDFPQAGILDPKRLEHNSASKLFLTLNNVSWYATVRNNKFKWSILHLNLTSAICNHLNSSFCSVPLIQKFSAEIDADLFSTWLCQLGKIKWRSLSNFAYQFPDRKRSFLLGASLR